MGDEMRPTDDSRADFSVLPPAAEPCVWMLAGVLTYRLCDARYDCERCPLDAAIRGVKSGPRDPIAVPGASSPGWGIRDDRRYHPAFGWVLELEGNRFRWGIDGFMVRLYDRITSIVLPASGTQLTQGQIACWIVDDSELVPLRCPASGRVTLTNQAAQRDPSLVLSSPYEKGWLVEMQSEGGLAGQAGLCDAAARRDGAARQLARFHRSALRHVRGDEETGLTAADGGERLTTIRRILGTRRYHRLILTALH